MKLLLSGDDYCCYFDGDFYVSESGLILINRYLNAFDHVLVAFRTKHVSSKNELEKFKYRMNDNRVSFIDIPFFQGPKQFLPKYLKIKKYIKNRAKECDFAILRLPSTTAFVAWQIVKANGLPYATEIVFDCYDAYESSDDFLSKYIWKTLHKMQVEACNNALGVSCVTEKYLQQRYYPLGKNTVTSNYSTIELTPDFFLSARNHQKRNISACTCRTSDSI